MPVSSFHVDDRTGNPVFAVNPITSKVTKPTKNSPPKKTNKKETMVERWNPLFADSGRASSEIPEWLQEFREILVDDEIPEHGDSHASSPHEASLEPIFKRREDLGKHSVYTHFSKDRNCEICKRTKLQGPHAEDAMAKPYLELWISVTW